MNSIGKLLNPASVAIIGANDKNSYAGRFLRNLINNGYTGKLYGVNPGRTEVLGIPCFPTIADVPGEVDLAAIIVKAPLVVDVVRQCAEKGVGSILIITSGFSEAGPEGRTVEMEFTRIANEAGIRILGPNTTGYANVAAGFWGHTNSTTAIRPLKSGSTALVSQSGSAGFGTLLTAAKDRGVGLKYIITTGNEADLNLPELVDYLLDEPDIHSVIAMIEGLRDVQALIRAAIKAKQLGKKIAVMKIGESEVGSRAASSHTASLTGDMATFNAITRQYGIIKADEYDELIEIAKLLQSERPIQGNRVCILSHSGGVSGYTGDMMGKYGLQVPVLSESTQAFIRSYTKEFGSPANPVDLTGAHMRGEAIIPIVRRIAETEPIDLFVMATNGNRDQMQNPLNAAETVGLPCTLAWAGSLYEEGLNEARERGIPISFSIRKLAKNLSKIHAAQETVIENPSVFPPVPLPQELVSGSYLDENAAKRIVQDAGVSVPRRRLLSSVSDLGDVLPGRYVLKIVSDTIIHKSDIGGVLVNLSSLQELKDGYEQLDRLRSSRSDIQGILVEEMADDGLDMVVGLRRDPVYGWVLVVGLGGIYTELFHLVSIRSLPVSHREVDRMLSEITGLDALLAGYRGQPGYDRTALIDAIERLAALACEHHETLDLIEINPLRVMPNSRGALALDCVIHIK